MKKEEINEIVSKIAESKKLLDIAADLEKKAISLREKSATMFKEAINACRHPKNFQHSFCDFCLQMPKNSKAICKEKCGLKSTKRCSICGNII